MVTVINLGLPENPYMSCSIIIIIITSILLVLVPWHRHVVFLCFPHHRLSLVALQVWKVKILFQASQYMAVTTIKLFPSPSPSHDNLQAPQGCCPSLVASLPHSFNSMVQPLSSIKCHGNCFRPFLSFTFCHHQYAREHMHTLQK